LEHVIILSTSTVLRFLPCWCIDSPLTTGQRRPNLERLTFEQPNLERLSFERLNLEKDLA
jgi:hypothetical protein